MPFVVIYDYGRVPRVVGLYSEHARAERIARRVREQHAGSVYTVHVQLDVTTDDGEELAGREDSTLRE